MGDWRVDPNYRAVRGNGHETGCTKPCCVSGDLIPPIPGENKWKRYALPGAIAAVFIIGVAASWYYHHVQQNNPERTNNLNITHKVK